MEKKEFNIEQEKLKLERQRLAIDTQLKKREMRFQRHQFEATRKGFAIWAQVITPVGAAIFAGIVGLFGTVWNGYQSNLIETKKQIANEKLERQKLESTLILDAIKTAGTGEEKDKHTAANLLFLSDAGFITLPAEKIDIIKEKAGDTLPSLPNIRESNSSNGPITPTLEVPVPAKNYKAQRDLKDIKFIVIHATESQPDDDAKSMVQFFHTTDRRASSHYLIGNKGTVVKILDESYVAIHTLVSGSSKDQKVNDQNSIGIHLVGFSQDGFTEQQVSKLEDLLVTLAKKFNIEVSNIVGHKEIVPPGSRIDPGPKLDLNQLREDVKSRLASEK